MSAVPSSISSPASVAHSIRSNSNRNEVFFSTVFNSRISSKPPLNHLFFRNSSGAKRKSAFTASRPFSPVMEWQDCVAKIEVDVPSSTAYNCYSDREAIPRWMPFISSVKVLEDKPDLSRWSLKYGAFGRDLEFSWLARNMQPIPNQKIHWRSLEGLPNKGAIRFYPKGPSSCLIELTVSYEVPQILTPVASTFWVQILLAVKSTVPVWHSARQRRVGVHRSAKKIMGPTSPHVSILKCGFARHFSRKIFLRRTSDLRRSMEISPHKHDYALTPWNIEDPSACKFSSCIN